MNTKTLHTLEFYKIIQQLKQFTLTSLGYQQVEELAPMASYEEIQKRLAMTEEAMQVVRLKGSAPFGGIRDIQLALNRAQVGGMLNVAELLDVATTISGGRKLKRFLFTAHEGYEIPLLMTYATQLSEHKVVQDRITRCIDDNLYVMDNASAELARIRGEIRSGEARIRDRLDQMLRTPSIQKMIQDAIVTMRGDRYVLPVKQEYRSTFSGIIHDQSASGATVFIEPEKVVALNNQLRELRIQEEVEINKILQMLSTHVAEVAADLSTDLTLLAEFDFVFAKESFARAIRATRPVLNNDGYMKIKRGRHPLIAPEVVVPMDIELGKNYSMIVVTGPNTGGKTVSLKTIGLLSLMSMSGLFIPADEGSQMCIFDAIYADIGDEQSIEQNLSTFSSHMTNIISILKQFTPKSLVLLDELGAGTDPTEGAALAISILDHFHRTKCLMVATTHYSELKAYAYDKKGTINASMEFDSMTLSPTYRLLVGVPGRSHAFAIATRLGLSTAIIQQARGRIGEDDQRVEFMIATLEEQRRATEVERMVAEQHRKEADHLLKEIQEERSRFEAQKDKLLVKAEQDAREAVLKAKHEAEQIMADLKRLAQEEAGSISIQHHKLTDIRHRLDQAIPHLRTDDIVTTSGKRKQVEQIKIGDEVRVGHLNRNGYVIERVSASEVVVQLGSMKMKVKLSDLDFIRRPSMNKQLQSSSSTSSLKRTRDEHTRIELDMRGMNLEEAIIETDRFLDESFLSNLGQVYLIHGKGTGVLRRGIQDFLHRHRHVKNYRLGNYNEGSAGVTVVELN